MIWDNLLVVSAALFEVKPTLDVLKKHGVQFEYIESGIGPIYAAEKKEKISALVKEKHALIIGSAGVFGDFEKPYLVCPEKIIWMPTAERMGLAKVFDDLYPPVFFKKTNRFDLSCVDVFSSTSVSLNDEILGIETKKTVENMELYPLARAVQGAISIEAILGITNKVGVSGSQQWLENFKAVAELTADHVNMFIAKSKR